MKIGTTDHILWNDLDYIVTDDHTHTVAEITDFGEYADVNHTHSVSNVTDLETSSMNITSPWTFTTPAFALSSLSAVSGAVSINLTQGCFFSLTISNAVTLSVTGSLTGTSAKNLGLVIINGGSAEITWSSVFKFPSGTVPTLTISGTDIITFVTIDNGLTWLNVGQVLDFTNGGGSIISMLYETESSSTLSTSITARNHFGNSSFSFAEVNLL